MKKIKFNPHCKCIRSLNKDQNSISEALGTILLLAVAIVLIASVAAWVQTIPQPGDHVNVKFDVQYSHSESNKLTIDIEHLGGDKLDIQHTTVRVNFLFPLFRPLEFKLEESNNVSLTDGYWSIGDHWNYTFSGISENAEVNVKVVETNIDQVIHDENILLGKMNEFLPDLEISPDNITFSFEDEVIKKSKLVKISAVIFNKGLGNATAIVRFFDDNRLIVSKGNTYKLAEVPYKYSASVQNFQKVTMTWVPDRWGEHTISVKIYSTSLETNYANNYASKDIDVEILVEPPTGPDLGTSPYDINPSTKYPVHGIDLNISIIFHNYGDLPVKPDEVFNITISLGNQTKIKTFYSGIRSRESLEFFVTFREVGPGGPANITVYVDSNQQIIEQNKANNIAIKNIQILPTILLVDDDGVKGGSRNVADKLMKSLTGRGITYDYYGVKGIDDQYPKYDSGPKKLINYDIVIWVTGYEISNTLTQSNLDNLKMWLSNNYTSNRLWLIGQDVLNDTVTTPGIINDSDFAYEYLGVRQYMWNSTPSILEGKPGDPITDGMYLNTSNYNQGMDRGLNITLRNATPNEQIFPILNNDTILGPYHCTALRYHNLSASSGFKVVFFSFELTSINSPYDISNVSYHVLKWFNYSISEGYDFGIVDQSFSTFSPNFMDVITISAVVVNNGPIAENVDVAFYKTGPDGVEKEIIEYPDDKENPQLINIPGNGGKRLVQKEWLATSVGDHNFRVMVDPFNHFQEIVEENNDFSYYGLEVTKLEIQYTVLVVDDDNSTNNGGTFADTVTPITDSLNELNILFFTLVVPGGVLPDNGPDIDTLKHYNTIVWLTGNDIGPTLTDIDQQNLEDFIEGNYEESKYLETKVNLFLVGQNILDDINGSGNNIQPGGGFVRDYLKISRYSTNIQLPNHLRGIMDNPVTHGSKYPISPSFSDNSDIIEKSPNSDYLFYHNISLNNHNSLIYNHEGNNSRICFLAWELSFLDNTTLFGSKYENYRNEFLYLILNWFQNPGDKVEFKVTNIDITLSEEKPNIGESYIITADVKNYGHLDSSTIVRFYDGDTIIDTDTIFIPAQGTSSAEIIWAPKFAGNRTIKVKVDMDDDTSEYFNILNNNASLPNTWVYFFYDDLENGIHNWDHDSTIIRINGESKLDYLDNPIYSDINDTWEEVLRFNINETEYHSAETSIYTLEPKGEIGRADILLCLVIDDSRSMTQRYDGSNNTWLSVAKNASKFLVSLLSDNSKVAIWHFRGSNEERALSFTTLTGSGRITVNNSIDGLTNPSGHTVLWDSIGEAYTDVKNAIASNPSLSPAVVVLSDGCDYQSADTSAVQSQKLEAASDNWCPWHNMSDGELNYTGHRGKYSVPFDTMPGVWYTPGSGSFDGDRYGLLNSDIKIYTIGLGLEHHSPPYLPSTPVFPGNGNSDNNATYSGGIESGTVEYNLWRVSTSSNAKYYYSPSTDELYGIFRDIAVRLGSVLARSSRAPENIYTFDFESGWQGWEHAGTRDEWERGDPTDPWDLDPHSGSYCLEIDLDRNYNRNANFWLNRTINLTGFKNCQMTFWHYFEIEDNYDGGCIMVSDNGGVTWTLVPPNLPSSGWDTNINGNNKYFNDLGHRQGWSTRNEPMGHNTWEEVIVDLSNYDDSEIIIRFWFSSDTRSGTQDDGWAIDDIYINGTKIVLKELSELYEPGYRNLTTYSFNLENASSAKISFFHKYSLRLGFNGVVALVGTPVGLNGSWLYEYTYPKQAYTGNFDISKHRYDDFGNDMRWCWNGISFNSKFDWEYIEISLDNWTGLSEVKIRLSFLWSGWGFGGVYMVDDFEIKVMHSDDELMGSNSTDQWQLTQVDSHSGDYCWGNIDPTTGYLRGGLDNSLYSRPIDITNARNATLSAYFKFNVNTDAGRPPDGFRVEVSADNGETWRAINMGSRAAWGVSGNDSDASDGIPGDGKSYTGINSGNNWVEANSLTRLNCDLTGWSGNVIIIRFRVITASDINPYFSNRHYELSSAGFGGLYIDDIIIQGFSLLEGS